MDWRDALKTAALGALALSSDGGAQFRYKRGPDNQRMADLGDGTVLNPVIAGDWPDPAIPIAKPKGGEVRPHGMALSDDVSTPLALGREWAFFRPKPTKPGECAWPTGRCS